MKRHRARQICFEVKAETGTKALKYTALALAGVALLLSVELLTSRGPGGGRKVDAYFATMISDLKNLSAAQAAGHETHSISSPNRSYRPKEDAAQGLRLAWRTTFRSPPVARPGFVTTNRIGGTIGNLQGR